jgi:DNA-binding transcriptional LysR family regulator
MGGIGARNLRSIDLNLLVSFEALLRDRNVTKAADRVGLAQPSMSNALARLRKTFGDELFVATSRGMRPTARALELAEPVSEALRQVRLALQDHPFDPATARRRFTIGATTNANFTLVPPLLEIFREAPSIDLHIRALTNQQTVQALDAEEIDLAIGVIAELPRRFSVRPLLMDRAVCVARRDHPALRNGLTLELLVALPHVRAALQESPVEAVDVALAYRGLERRFAMIVPNLLLMPIVVARSAMLGILPEKAAKPIADPGRLAVHEIPLDLAPWMLSVICSRRREKDTGVRWLCDRICATFAEARTERFAETRPEPAAM